ncbi:DNA-(apurinic or apyrimidinic site) lyase [Trichonephila inaurata madagascariensis]|uniref:DNA-(apurinic or apyrimidinic site) endonuclease n=1 Tax=Trichonephila inaurata madagascariensis TaxID=2747483 RepID=A0A8X6M8K3_9ARAC|nr:DNA-(apurinic or apyrimidinic site) lyase [Trichonephila inaurata madagascariensis]
MAEKAVRRGRSAAVKVEVNGHINAPKEVVGKRGKKAIKTDNKSAAKIENEIPEKEEESLFVENKDLPKKRGKKQPESKPSEVDNASDKIIIEAQEVKDLPAKRGRKKVTKHEDAVVANDTEQNEDIPVKKKKKESTKNRLKTIEDNVKEKSEDVSSVDDAIVEQKKRKLQKTGSKTIEDSVKEKSEDVASVDDAIIEQKKRKIQKTGSKTIEDNVKEKSDLASVDDATVEQKKKKVQKTGSKIIEANVKEKSPLAGETRELKVALKRNRSLDNMAATQFVEDNEAVEEQTVKVAVKRNKKLDKKAAVQALESNEALEEEPLVKTTKGPAKGKRAATGSKEDSKPAKKTKENASKSNSGKKEKIPDVTALDFGNESKTADGKAWNLKMASWNINGIRAWLEKNGMSYLHHEKPDILCLQETKCSDDKLPPEVNVEGYHSYWLSGDKDGYSGVGLLSKQKPLSVQYGIEMEKHDNEGRVITAEYDEFYLVATYVPNAGRGLVRLDYRQEWDKDLLTYLKKLDEKKPVVLCGDLNVAHEEIDLANPKTNKKNAGFTKEEREGFSTLLSEGFVDTFRHLYPDEKGAYTFWTYMMNARAKNVGWRLDYFVVSKRFVNNICDSIIRKDVYGSDHCPICLFLNV